MNRLARYDRAGRILPALGPNEALSCVACGVLIEPANVDAEIGQTVRECGRATCFQCGSVDSFERVESVRTGRRIAERWGQSVADRGWTPIPNLLLRHANDLGLASSDLAVLAALASHDRGAAPVFPSKQRLAHLAGCDPSTAGRRIIRMECAGLLEVQTRRRGNGSRTTNGYTWRGLRRALAHIAVNIENNRPGVAGLADLLRALAAEGAERNRLRVRPADWARSQNSARRNVA